MKEFVKDSDVRNEEVRASCCLTDFILSTKMNKRKKRKEKKPDLREKLNSRNELMASEQRYVSLCKKRTSVLHE